MNTKELLEMISEQAFAINTSKLIFAKAYSPIYDKTFDELTENEMKHQLYVWLEEESHNMAFGNSKGETK